MKEKTEKEFVEFLDNYKGLISKVSGIYCHNPEEKKDLIQEIIIQLWKAFPKYNNKYSLATWMYRIAFNVSISFLRHGNSQRRFREAFKKEMTWVELNPPSNDERIEKLYHFIDLLKPLDKAIIMLYLEEQSNKEIAHILGLSESNVSTRKLRIKETLRSYFENQKTQKNGL